MSKATLHMLHTCPFCWKVRGLIEYLDLDVDLVSVNGLKIKKYQSYGSHYSSTLKLWRDEFLKKWDEISKQGFDLTFKRMWDFYCLLYTSPSPRD